MYTTPLHNPFISTASEFIDFNHKSVFNNTTALVSGLTSAFRASPSGSTYSIERGDAFQLVLTNQDIRVVAMPSMTINPEGAAPRHATGASYYFCYTGTGASGFHMHNAAPTGGTASVLYTMSYCATAAYTGTYHIKTSLLNEGMVTPPDGVLTIIYLGRDGSDIPEYLLNGRIENGE